MARDLGGAQRPALNLGAHGVEAVGRRRRRDGDQAAGRLGEAAEGRLGQAELVGADQPSSVSSSVASSTLELQRSSTRLKPRNTSGRSAFDRREITTTFSRPVSRLTRRIFSCGREVLGAFMLRGPSGKALKLHSKLAPQRH